MVGPSEDKTLLNCEKCGGENGHLEVIVLCKSCKGLMKKYDAYSVGKIETPIKISKIYFSYLQVYKYSPRHNVA